MSVLRRFYRVRSLSALLLCMPGVALCLWYAWSAYARLDRYTRAAREDMHISERHISVEDFHVALFDVLRRDLRRMLMPSPPDPTDIDTFVFHIDADDMDTLMAGKDIESKRPYVPVKIERAGALQKLEVRLRGHRPWHIVGKKKSMKLRLPKGELLDGNRVFNLINDPTPMVVGEQIILDLASELGIMTPKSSFARVHINGADLGVFHYYVQVDECLLRNNKRTPGNIYSGNLPPSARTEELWTDVARWKKVAWRNENAKDDRSDLERLLQKINSADLSEFAEFARQEMDLEAFAAFEALDVIFGGDQHDFRQNHKIYFDPYRGRWEPIAWNFRGFKHEEEFNLAENPIWLRLKMVPEYLSLRNSMIYELLNGACRPSSVRARGMKILSKVAPDLITDPYWDAYKLLPRVDKAHRFMMRPMNLDRLTMVFESEIATFSKRHEYLISELSKNPLWIVPVADDGEAAMHLVVDGYSAVRITGFKVVWPAGCGKPSWRILSNDGTVTPAAISSSVELSRPMDLFPGVKLAARADPNPKRGRVHTEMVPAAYEFQVQSDCAPEELEAEGILLATGARIRSRTASPQVLEKLKQSTSTLEPYDVPELDTEQLVAHPWQHQLSMPRTVHIGPGIVEISGTLVFPPDQSVEVEPGTHLIMGADSSLIFRGSVAFNGAKDDPIVIEAGEGEPWGGIALQGPGTSGSSLHHVVAAGGSSARWNMIPYPGMINFHDTEEISINHCTFSDNHGSDDVVHVVYVRGFSAADCVVQNADSDAWDLEFSEGILRRVEVRRAGDDGLDFMSSRVEVVDCLLLSCKGNGISAGERSDISVRDALVADSRVGILAKDASTVDTSGCLLYDDHTGVETYKRTVYYEGANLVQADVLYIVDCNKDIKRGDQSSNILDFGMIQSRLPQSGTLDHLVHDVLALSSTDELDAWLATRVKEEAP